MFIISKKNLITILLLILCFGYFSPGIASSANLKYYGYYGAPVMSGSAEEANLSLFTNTVFIGYGYSSKTYDDKINFAYNNGYKVILTYTAYYNRNFWDSESVLRSFLSGQKTLLGSNADKVLAFNLMDEPNTTNSNAFVNGWDKANLIINLSKEYFPNIKTFVVFSKPWSSEGGNSVLNNPNLDFIALDPYFFNTSYEASSTDPFACNTTNKQAFYEKMYSLFYWVKSGGLACKHTGYCTATEMSRIDTTVHSDSPKKIVLIPQNFKCNEYLPYFCISQIPSICQQQWYYDWAKSDPDVLGVIGYEYETVENYSLYLAATTAWCLGIGEHVPDMLNQHKIWGKEVMCSIQDFNPFCGVNGVSYRNAEQAKCNNQSTIKPGGAGNNLCSSTCGADSACNGIIPGVGKCDKNCKLISTHTPTPTPKPIPTVNLLVNGSNGSITIPYNTSVNLSWTSTNATSCSASGVWSGTKLTSGTESTGNLLSSKTYTLTCTGSGGSVSDSVTVNVSTGDGGGYIPIPTPILTSTPTPILVVGPVTIPTLPAKPTITDYQNLLDALIKQLAYLQGQLAIQRGATGYQFTRNLQLSDSGENVRQLQIFLKAQGTEIYSEGLVTGYFGSLTKKAVERFQTKYDIAKAGDEGYGYVGPKTRAKINSLQGL